MAKHEEDRLQQLCVLWFDIQYPHLQMLLHHSPNGGLRNAREGARFKTMGVRAGFPDLVLLVPSQQHHALFMEMKSEKGTRSEAQKEYEPLLHEAGYSYTVVRSLEQFKAVVTAYINHAEPALLAALENLYSEKDKKRIENARARLRAITQGTPPVKIKKEHIEIAGQKTLSYCK